MITLLFTDGALAPIGQPIVRFISVTVTLNFNAPASVTVTLPALPEYLDVAAPGNRLQVIRDGKILVAGPVEYPGVFSWSADGQAQDATPGLLTVAATDDSVWLGCRIVYPDPAAVATAQTATSFYTLTATNAETAMRSLVNVNAGPGALTARRVPNLTLGTLAGVGTSVNVHSRFDVLSDVLRATALAGGGLGYQVVEDGGSLKFVVFQPPDLSASIRFSRGLGNLRSIQYTPQAPTSTVAIVGGDGTGTSRTIVERSNSAAIAAGWGRIETFVNDNSGDTTDLNQAGDTALTDAAEQGQLVIQAIDTPLVKFGRDYPLGAKVSAEIYPGLDLVNVVRSVIITETKDGEVVNPQIGTASASSDPTYVRKLRALDRRLGQLERT